MAKNSFKVKNSLNISPIDPSTLVNPEAGDLIIDSTDSNKIKAYNSSASAFEEIKGAGGGINYISNYNFDSGIQDWSGDTNLTISHETSAPLRGTGSLKIAKSAVDASTQVVSVPFTVDTADLAKKLVISFDVDASHANYADGDMRVQIVKDPNGTPVVIRANGEDINGGKVTHFAQFQTDATITEYELQFYVVSTNASAYDIYVDNVIVGPRELAKGSIATDWSNPETTIIEGSTTNPTKGTVAEDFTRYRRVGTNANIELSYRQTAAGTAGSGFYLFSLPNGLRFDDSVVLSTSASVFTNSSYYGSLTVIGGSTAVVSSLKVIPYDSTRYRLFMEAANTDAGAGTVDSLDYLGSSKLPLTSTNYMIRGEFSVPILGWSANSTMSEDLGGREVVVRGAGNGGTALTANTTLIDFIEVEDTTSSWNGTQFTAPETGNYSITGAVQFTTSVAASVRAYVNGTTVAFLGLSQASSSAKSYAGTLRLEKGDILDLRSDTNATLSNVSTTHFIHIQKLASPQTTLETETVAARYTSNAGQTPSGSTDTTIIYEDLVEDTHNAMNTSTGIYTVPVSGWYMAQASVGITVSISAAQGVALGLDVDGTQEDQDYIHGSATSSFYNPKPQFIKYLEKGQQVKAVYFSQAGGVALNTDKKYVNFAIARIK